MKTLIYQFWKGEVPDYARLSRRLFRDYADRHGADYFFEENPTFFTGKYAEYYHAVRPVWDPDFHNYDRVIYVDADVFPKDNASGEILTTPVNHIGMVEELAQPQLRKGRKSPIRHSNDMRWAAFGSAFFHSTPPRTADRSPRVFNSGVIAYTREGMVAAYQHFPQIRTYVMAMRLALLPRFYRLDQNYLGISCFRAGMQFTALEQRWNRILEQGDIGEDYLARETKSDTAFVHWQVRNRKEICERQILDLVASA
ncbi:glycosyltransferase [Rhizobium sp. FKY42]|uniref:glycosyltransferase n=1 Tax=Rhizobium sp. FKY42 TaxID=2562310 RepID=UPI001485B1FF|nr:glycosyltransferase [Rhizobium sp. FKY42]